MKENQATDGLAHDLAGILEQAAKQWRGDVAGAQQRLDKLHADIAEATTLRGELAEELRQEVRAEMAAPRKIAEDHATGILRKIDELRHGLKAWAPSVPEIVRPVSAARVVDTAEKFAAALQQQVAEKLAELSGLNDRITKADAVLTNAEAHISAICIALKM
jgi:hypothetical protein